MSKTPIVLVSERVREPAPHPQLRGLLARDYTGVTEPAAPSHDKVIPATAGGHIFYGKGSCTNNTVDSYLLTGKLPAGGKVCHDQEVGLDAISPSE